MLLHFLLDGIEIMFVDYTVPLQAALSNTGLPKVNVIAADATSSGDQPEVDVSDEEFLQFDTSAVPVIVTLTKVSPLSSRLSCIKHRWFYLTCFMFLAC